MTDVASNLKDLVDCPCGRPECHAYGRLSSATGHVVDCRIGCPVCDSGRPKVKATKPIPAGTRRQLRARARGQCEAAVSPDCTGRGVHAHHKAAKGAHGRDDSLSNLLYVCHRCHDHIHANPAESYERGFLERTTAE